MRENPITARSKLVAEAASLNTCAFQRLLSTRSKNAGILTGVLSPDHKECESKENYTGGRDWERGKREQSLESGRRFRD